MAPKPKLQSSLSTFEGLSAPVNARNPDLPLSKQNVIVSFLVSSSGEPNSSPFDAKSVVDVKVRDAVLKYVSDEKLLLKAGSGRTFFWPADKLPYKSLSLAAVPEQDTTTNDDNVNKHKEKIREAYASCVGQLQALNETEILLDDTTNMLAASEACHLMSWNFDMYKVDKNRKPTINIDLLNPDSPFMSDYEEGFILADCQNLARTLQEMPSNRLTPILYCEHVKKVVDAFRSSSKLKVEVIARDEKWLKEQKMGGFLGVAQGSVEMPRLLEIHITHPEASKDSIKKPLVFTGKGITFDTGGISLKTGNFTNMRADMGGAAVLTAATIGAMRLGVKGKIVCLCGMTENMPSGSAYKPSDVVTTRSGLTIQVDNTDAEGRVVLADVLDYAETFNPATVLSSGTLASTGLGQAFAAAYCRDTKTFDMLRKAGSDTGDQVWRMPLDEMYDNQVTNSTLADTTNTKNNAAWGSAASVVCAAFLNQFAKCADWAHLDISGIFQSKGDIAKYLHAGQMTGRPTRTVIRYIQDVFK